MKHRIFYILLCLLTAVLMINSGYSMYSAATNQNDSTATVLRLACYGGEDHPSTITAQYFAKQVNQRTHGRIDIQVIPSSQLGSEEETIEQLDFGGIAFSIVNCLSLPDELCIRKPDSAALTVDAKKLSLFRFELLSEFAPDYRCIASNQELLTHTSQCKNQKIGTYTTGNLQSVLERCGFEVLPYSSNNLIGSIHYGYIDCVELPFMYYATEEYAKSLPYLSFYDAPMAPDVLLASQVSMGNLLSEDQKIIRNCAKKVAQYQRAILNARQDAAASQLQKSGVKFYPPEIPYKHSIDWVTLGYQFIGREVSTSE